MFNVFGRPAAAAHPDAGHAHHGGGAAAAAAAAAAPPPAPTLAVDEELAKQWKEELKKAKREQERKAERMDEEVERIKELAKEHYAARRMGCFRVLVKTCAQGRKCASTLRDMATKIEGVQEWLKVQVAMKIGTKGMGMAARMISKEELKSLAALGVESAVDSRRLVSEFQQAGFMMDIQGEALKKGAASLLDDDEEEATREMRAELAAEISRKQVPVASGVRARRADVGADVGAGASAAGAGARVAIAAGGGGGGGGAISDAELDRVIALEIDALMATEEGREAVAARL